MLSRCGEEKLWYSVHFLHCKGTRVENNNLHAWSSEEYKMYLTSSSHSNVSMIDCRNVNTSRKILQLYCWLSRVQLALKVIRCWTNFLIPLWAWIRWSLLLQECVPPPLKARMDVRGKERANCRCTSTKLWDSVSKTYCHRNQQLDGCANIKQASLTIPALVWKSTAI